MSALKSMLFTGLAGAALIAPAAHAQQAAQSAGDPARDAAWIEGEVIVTGTRIARTGYSAPVPLTVIDEAQISASGSNAIINVLRETPAITAGLDSSNGGANTDGGAAFVNLRGLGTNRSLTLVNGRRRVSGSSTSSAVDLNTIPAAMVERAEITTGGASAIYGADAVSGVVNIITRRNFQGLELAARGGISDRGDAETYSLSLFAGAKFLDDRGAINFAATYGEEGGLSLRDRPYTRYPTLRRANPLNTGANDGVPDTITHVNADIEYVHYVPDATFLIKGRPWFYGPGGLVDATPQTVTTSGELMEGFGVPGEANLGEGSLRLNSQVLSMRSDLKYELADGITLFAEGEFTRTESAVPVQYYRFDHRSLWFDGRGGPRIRTDNYFLPSEVAALMASAGVTEIGVRRRMVDELGVVTDYHDRKAFSVVAGLEGRFRNDWNWDISYQYGQALDDIETPNLLRGQNFLNATDVIADPVTGQPVCRDAAARADNCAPYNIFVRGPLTEAQSDYFVGGRIQYTRNSQQVLAAHLNGDLFRLPAGAVSFAAGVEHREEGLRTRDDGAMLNGDVQWGVGIHATPREPLDETFTVSEGYLEVLVPLLSDLPFIDSLSVDGAVRVSDYNTIGSTVAWQAGVNWNVTEDVRLRFTRSRSVRAPNLLELFGPVTVTLTSATNPCNATNIGASDNRLANCVALGNPATGGSTLIPSIRVISGGNADAQEETSNSMTLGAVFTPRAIPSLRLSADYYNIRISNVLSSFGQNDMYRGCLDASTMSGNVFCENIVFAPGGDVETVYTRLINASSYASSGVDLAANYAIDVGRAGRVRLGLVATYLLKKEFLGVSGNPTTLSIRGGEYTDPSLRLNLTVGYQRSNWGVRIVNRYISDSVIDEQARPEAMDINDVSSRLYTNAVFDLDLTSRVSGFVGVNNIFAVRPPQTPETYSYGSFYDTIGRFFHFGVKARF